MIKIGVNNYYKCIKIFRELNWHLSSLAVLAGNNPGEVLVDSLQNPESVFMISPEGCYLAGEAENDKFIAEMKEYFENDFIQNWTEDEFEVIFLPKWKTASKIIFGSRPLIGYKRFHYTVDLKKFTVDVNAQIFPIGTEFVRNNLQLKNMDHIKNWIMNNWGSYKKYDETGFGNYYLAEDRILSWSVCDCIYKNRCEIGIWTDDENRRKGFASNVVRSMLKSAKDRGMTEVGWHCSSDNIGSYKTAEKAGFRKEREYFAYYGFIDKNRYK